MLARFLVRAIFAAIGLWLSAVLLHAVSYHSVGTLIAAGVLLGIVNAFVRPVIVVLTLPLTLITLGFFLLIVNAAMIGLVSVFLPGFHVHGLIGGVIAAIVTGATSWLGHMMIRPGR